MNSRLLMKRLIELGVAARQTSPTQHARPSDARDLAKVSTATIAYLLGTMGEHQLTGSILPYYTADGTGSLKYQVTERAELLASDAATLDEWLDSLFPPPIKFDLFMSYATAGRSIADELRDELQKAGVNCFMAEKNVKLGVAWQPMIRSALQGSERMLVLLTPRSVKRPWVHIETGAAWALDKPIIPAVMNVELNKLTGPILGYQACVINTVEQRHALVATLGALSVGP